MTLLSWDGQVLPNNENTKIILYTERKCKRIMKMWALKLDCHGWNPVPVLFSDVALKVKVLATQSGPTLCNFTDCSPPGSSVRRLGKLDVTLCVMCAQSCLTFCNPMDYSPPGSSVHGILQARILQRVAMPSSKGSSWPQSPAWIKHCSPARQADFLPSEPPGKPQEY